MKSLFRVALVLFAGMHMTISCKTLDLEFCKKLKIDTFYAKQFQSHTIGETIAKRIVGKSWKESCPVKLDDLRYLTIPYWSYEDRQQLGEMVVHEKIAPDILKIFAELFAAKFPIQHMQLVDNYDANDDLSMGANNSSCFCYRPNTTNPHLVSLHGYGLAIDINPLINPYLKGNLEEKDGVLKGDLVLPAEGINYLDRIQSHTGIIIKSNDNACYQIFTKYGFKWGGDAFLQLDPPRIDLQHFYKELSDVGL